MLFISYAIAEVVMLFSAALLEETVRPCENNRKCYHQVSAHPYIFIKVCSNILDYTKWPNKLAQYVSVDSYCNM